MIARIKAGRRTCRRTWALRALLVAIALTSVTPSFAQTSIGSATTIERDVSGTLRGRTRAVAQGDGVFSNENIRTANLSAAQLRFLDQSSLAMGPSASVVLDRFVYNPDQTAREAALQVTTGAARWVGGTSPSRAYRLRTPQAVIGVRGTSFDLLVEPSRTIITLREGVILVCLASAPRRCATLDTPGQIVVVGRSTIDGPRQGDLSPTQFADNCLGPVDSAACIINVPTRQAAEPTPEEAAPPARRLVTAPPPVRRRVVTAPPPQIIEQPWQSSYVGVTLGVVSNRSSVDVDGSNGLRDSIALRNVPSDVSATSAGAIGGVQIGHTWQIYSSIVGLEADFSALSGTAQETIVRNPLGIVVTSSASQRTDFLSTFRARAGFAVADTLFYATGGLAVGHVKLDGSIAGACQVCTVYIGNESTWRAGYVVGGGVEQAISRANVLRLEFLYYDLGTQTMTLPETTGNGPGEFATMRFRSSGAIVRAGFNARF